MTELETIQHAKNYLDKLAQGIDPLTNQPIPDGELLNNIRISRCLFFTSGILGKVLANGGVGYVPKPVLPPFAITDEQLAQFVPSDEPLRINQLVGRISELVPPNTVRKLTYAPVTAWLSAQGFLADVQGPSGKHGKRPTQAGNRLGITTEQHTGQYGPFTAVVYNRNAQEFIIAHLQEMLEAARIEREG